MRCGKHALLLGADLGRLLRVDQREWSPRFERVIDREDRGDRRLCDDGFFVAGRGRALGKRPRTLARDDRGALACFGGSGTDRKGHMASP